MNVSISTTAFDRAIAPLLRMLSPQQAAQIADFHADEVLQCRVEELARQANEGELSEDDRAEYEGYAYANKVIAVLKAQAKRYLDAGASG